jgi:hypothetical protein
MRSALLGRPARGGVCLVAARGRGQRPVGSAPGRPRCHARSSLLLTDAEFSQLVDFVCHGLLDPRASCPGI